MDSSRAAALAKAAAAAAGATLCYCAPSSGTPSGSAEGRRLVVVGTGAERDPNDAHKWVQ